MTKTRVQRLDDVAVSKPLSEKFERVIKPELFVGKVERRIGRAVGVTQFGVNHVTLDPGSISSLRHWHEAEDEFVYVIEGELMLVDESGEHLMKAGAVAGFPFGVANAHHLINRSNAPAKFLVVGSRRPDEDAIHYPDDPLVDGR